MSLRNKSHRLKAILKDMRSALVAFSGGVDSTLLLKVAFDALGKENVLAVTATSATYPKEELISAKKTAKLLKAKHTVIETDELSNERFKVNPIDRCYFCKKELFLKLNKIAKSQAINFVVDASNLSDKKDFRPGSKAKSELGIRSPLEEAGLTKEDVRKLSKELGLPTWDKPSLACLASRIPYGTEIKNDTLKKINKGEKLLRDMGFKQVRLRYYDGLCRIEVPKQDIPGLLKKNNLIVAKLKALGYNYITVDLEGYRSGSMNLAIDKKLKDKALSS